jgi:para-aminobenzoate synthetase component 1
MSDTQLRDWSPVEPWVAQEVIFPDDRWAAAQAFAAGGELAWLDTGNPDAGDQPGISLIAANPVAVLEQLPHQSAGFIVEGKRVASAERGWDLWQQSHRRLRCRPINPGPLPVGWIGALGFESAEQLEHLPPAPRDDWCSPLLRMALFDRAIILEVQQQRAWLALDPTLRSELGLAPLSVEETVERWSAAANAIWSSNPTNSPRAARESEPEAHIARVKRALDYIAAGDIYQVNICQRLRITDMPAPMAAFRAVQSRNPAPYGAMLRWGDRAVLSASPERLLSYDGSGLLTQPIKGTRPRSHDPALDSAAIADLLASAKDRAELTMIVDLHRNDLGRVAELGSVKVTAPHRLEAHPAVFHTVADIVAKLAHGNDALDALRAMFPAGSIVGVPKIRALEIIRELEPVPRGVATGAVGVLGLDGRLSFNVAIRTLQQCGSQAVLHVGGGIVADSEPLAEFIETLDKARGLLAALRASGDALTMPDANVTNA